MTVYQGSQSGLTGLPLDDRLRKYRADLERLICWYFGPDEQDMAVWVAWQVSGMEPLAYHRNGGMGIGLFDVTTEDAGLSTDQEWTLHNPIRNVATAHRVWAKNGWARWKVPPLPVRFDDEPLPEET